MTEATIAHLIELQEPDGCFSAEVRGPHGTFKDCNGFTTAMVLRALRDLPAEAELKCLRSRALDYLETCYSTQVDGAFGFWPEGARPAWAPRLPADVDDTAIMTLELLRYGRRSQRDGLRTVCTVLLSYRLTSQPDEQGPSWIAPGAFLTWIGPPGRPNLVDCCVNANVAALMARVKATHLPGYQEAVRTILDGLAWSGGRPARQHALTPFYPSVDSLLEAVEHAIECGAQALTPALDELRQMAAGWPPEDNPYCCSSAYGATVWHSQALEEAQALRKAVQSLAC
jgi:hypothetical protein